MKSVAPLSEDQIESLARVLGQCGTGSEISRAFHTCGLTDDSELSTKWARIAWVFNESQRQHGCTDHALRFIQVMLAPVKFVERIEVFERHRLSVNMVLAFSGIEYGADGEFRQREVARTLDESERRATTIRAKTKDRNLRPEVSISRNLSKYYDVFISHAEEDKEEVARPLANALSDLGLKVWYDEFELRIGDSLRGKIDAGLASSRFGIVVLSPSFLAKNWPQYELDGLVMRETTGEKTLLPLWQRLTKTHLIQQSPSLADKVARSTSDFTIDQIAREIADLVSDTEG